MYLQCPCIPSTTVVDICLRQRLSVLIHNLSFEVMNNMKIIYVNCGVKNYIKEDHHSYATFAVAKRKAEKKFRLVLDSNP